jgi:membrane protein DedA with SNARE-associated domain
LWLAAVRIVVGIIAIPLAPILYKKHFLFLVLMRPTKEVLLAAGFLTRQHKINLIEILAAAVPLAIFGVWHSFALGRGYATEIRNGEIPGIGKRVLPVNKIRSMQKLLRKKGTKLVVVGRLAAFPSAIVGAAAGSSGMSTKKFLVADGFGGLLSIAEAVGAGYLLGSAYQDGKKWLTLVGVIALIALSVVVGRYLRRDG